MNRLVSFCFHLFVPESSSSCSSRGSARRARTLVPGGGMQFRRGYCFSQSLRKMGMIRIARMFTTLIIGLMAGPAVSL